VRRESYRRCGRCSWCIECQMCIWMEDLVAERNRLAGDVGHSARVNEQHGGLSDRATINTSAVAAEASAIPRFRFPVRRPILVARLFIVARCFLQPEYSMQILHHPSRRNHFKLIWNISGKRVVLLSLQAHKLFWISSEDDKGTPRIRMMHRRRFTR
jgi:hypothetical protein